MTEELYKRYRPTTFSQVVGQDAAIKSLVEMGKNGGIPHTLLFTGESGTGKTTLARILRCKLKCSDMDFQEVNASEDRGIDLVRRIMKQVGVAPIAGKCRVWLIDECFPANALVGTPDGDRSIESIKAGDLVHSLSGPSIVRKTFRNKVPLDRLVKIYFSDGRSQVTTRDHLFLTDSGWVKAGQLKGYCVFDVFCYPMTDVGLPFRRTRYEEKRQGIDLSVLQSRISQHSIRSKMLLEELWTETTPAKIGAWEERVEELRRMWQGDGSNNQPQVLRTQEVLQSIMRREVPQPTTGVSREALYQEDGRKDFSIVEGICGYRKRAGVKEEIISADERKESGMRCSGGRENQTNEIHERDFECLDWREGRQWESNDSSNQIEEHAESKYQMVLGIRSSNSYESREKAEGRFSDQLQGRHRLQGNQDSDRSRWQWASIEREYVERCQEGKEANAVRVVYVESYEPTSNGESFGDVISNQDRDRGFVEFFDLEIDGHPSYFVNRKCVHNCHALTPDSQNAFLKLLEDTPKHVYFFLATTDPQKLKKTIVTRCTEIKCKPIKPPEMRKLIETIVKKEWKDNKTLDEDVCNRIIEVADGSARKALVILNQVIGLDTVESQLAAIESNDVKGQAIEIARSLIKGVPWKQMAEILKKVDEEPETIRWMVLGYCKAILLNGQNDKAAAIIDEFRDNWYDSKHAGLVVSCYNVLRNNS